MVGDLKDPVYHLKGTILPENEKREFWIVNGRVSFVQHKNAVELAQNAFIIGGLVDAHFHLTMDFGDIGLSGKELVRANLEKHLEHGTLFVRDVGLAVDVPYASFHDEKLPHVQHAGRFLAPARGYFGMQKPTSPENLVQAAVEQVENGAGWAKFILNWPLTADVEGLNYPKDVVVKAVRAVHDAGGRVAVHVSNKDGVALAVEAGVDSIEHGFGMEEEMFGEMAQKKIAWTPTLVILPIGIEMPVIKNTPRAAKYYDSVQKGIGALVKKARKAGVRILAGTDMLPAGSLVEEIVALSECGLSPREAIAAASTEAREFLNFSGFNENSVANIVVYDEDPTQNLRTLKSPKHVMLNGKARDHHLPS